MDMETLEKVFLLHYIIGVTQSQLVYHTPDVVEHGTSVTIGCHFDAKTPGSIYWKLLDDAMTQNCDVYPSVESVLYKSDDCHHQDVGVANYTFIIRSADIERDTHGWKCTGGHSPANLHIDIRVLPTGVTCYTESGSFEIGQGESFEVTCESSCAYMYQEMKWCFSPGDSSGCSNEQDYWTPYFDSDPEITYHNTSCSSSKYLQMYGSTFKANVLGEKNRDLELDVFISFGTDMFPATYGTNKIRIRYCLGCLAVWAIVLIVILIILALAGGIYGGIRLQKKYLKQHTAETDVPHGKETLNL